MRQREFDTKTPRNKYKLMRGTHDGIDKDGARVRYVAGEKDNDVVLLTDKQALAFRHKFKPMDSKGKKLFGEDDFVEPIEPDRGMEAPAATEADEDNSSKQSKADKEKAEDDAKKGTPQQSRMTTPPTTGPSTGEQKK